MVLLGAGFAPAPFEQEDVNPPEPDLLALRLELVLEALDGLRDSLTNLPTPQVFIDAPDLSAIVQAVNGLKPGADADQIAQAVVKQIAPTAERPHLDALHAELADVLKKLDFRLKGVGNSFAVSPPAGLNVLNTTSNPVPVNLTNASVEIANDSGNPLPISGTVTVNPNSVIDTAGNDNIVTGTITVADAATTSTAGQGGQSILSGTAAANSTVTLTFPTVNGTPESQSNFVVQVGGAFTGTYVFERSADGGTTWTSVGAFIAGTQLSTSSGTLPGVFHGNCAGTTNVRVRATALTSGSITVRLNSGIGTGTITLGAINPGAAIARPAERYARTTGNCFFASSGNLTLAAAGNVRATFTNPSGNSRRCFIYKIQAWSSTNTMAHLYINPTTGLPATAKTINKVNLGSSASSSVTVYADTNLAVPLSGGTDTGLDVPLTTGAVQPMELDPFIIPAGVTVGFNVPFTGAGNGVLTIYWYEDV